MEDATTFAALVSDFQTDHFPHVIMGQPAPRRPRRQDKEESAFAERFRDFYASSSRDIASSLIVLACLILSTVFAVLAIALDARSILILLGSLVVTILITSPLWTAMYKQIPQSRWYLLIPFFSLLTLLLIPLGFDSSLVLINTLSVFLLVLGIVNGTRRPVSPRGQLCYALLTLEATARQGMGPGVKRLPEQLAATVDGLSVLLLHYYGMDIENRKEIEVAFNKRLLFEKESYLSQLRFFDQPELFRFFAQRTLFFAGMSEAEMRSKPKSLRRGLQMESDAEQRDVYDRLDVLVKQLESLTVEFRLERVTLGDRLNDQIGKVVSVISLLASLLLGVLEFIDYTGWPFRLR
jgi:hypothetical protein